MEDYQVKDIILKYMMDNRDKMTLDLSKELGLNHDQVYSCCSEMKERDHLIIQDIATRGASYVYMINSHPIGRNFYVVNKGYTKEFKDQKWQNMPKKRWVLIAIIAYGFGIASPIIVQYSIKKIWPESSQSLKANQIKSDSILSH